MVEASLITGRKTSSLTGCTILLEVRAAVAEGLTAGKRVGTEAAHEGEEGDELITVDRLGTRQL